MSRNRKPGKEGFKTTSFYQKDGADARELIRGCLRNLMRRGRPGGA